MNHTSFNQQNQKDENNYNNTNISFQEFNINQLDYETSQNSVLIKDMLFIRQKNSKLGQILNPHRNNVIMQKWSIKESQRNQNSQIRQQKLKNNRDENNSTEKEFSGQQERRFSQGETIKIEEYVEKTQSQKNGIVIASKQNNSNNSSEIKNSHNSSNIPQQTIDQAKHTEVVKTVQYHLDTNNRFLENLNKSNYFTERTNSLIEMNKRKQSKQNSNKKSTLDTSVLSISKNDQNNSLGTIQIPELFENNLSKNILDESQKNKMDGIQVNNTFSQPHHYSNLLINHKSISNLIGQENQHLVPQNKKQIIQTILPFNTSFSKNKKRDDLNSSRNHDDDIRKSNVNKSDNEIRFGNNNDLEFKQQQQQNLSLSDVHQQANTAEKYVKPKRQLLQFPQQDFQSQIKQQNQPHQIPNLSHMKTLNKKPFTSGASSHQGNYQLPYIRNGLKRNSQSPNRQPKQDISTNDYNKTQQTLVSEYFNKTIQSCSSPPPCAQLGGQKQIDYQILTQPLTLNNTSISNYNTIHTTKNNNLNNVNTQFTQIKLYSQDIKTSPSSNIQNQFSQFNNLNSQHNSNLQPSNHPIQSINSNAIHTFCDVPHNIKDKTNNYQSNFNIKNKINQENLEDNNEDSNKNNNNSNNNLSQINFYNGQSNSPSPLLNNQKINPNQTKKGESHFIELNKKNLKYLGQKKKSPYNNIVDSILKQYEVKEKEDKKTAQKEKRKKLQSMFKQGEINNSNLCSLNNQHQFNFNTNKNLTTTLGNESFVHSNKLTNPSPDGRGGASSLTNRQNQQIDSTSSFQPQGLANRNVYSRDKKSCSPYQQYLEKQIELETRRQVTRRFQQQNSYKEGNISSLKYEKDYQDELNKIQNDGSYQQEQQYQESQKMQYRRKVRSSMGKKQQKITIEDYVNSEQLKQKVLSKQQLKSNQSGANYSPPNHIHHESRLIHPNNLGSLVITEQLQMTQNLQKQASLLKNQFELINNSDQSAFIKNALNNAGQTMLHIQKWRGENNCYQNQDSIKYKESKKCGTSSGIRNQKYQEYQQSCSSSDLMIIDEDHYSVNHRSKYIHDKIDANYSNKNGNNSNNLNSDFSSKKRIRSQNSYRVNASHDFNQNIKNKNKEINCYQNEIQPWDTNDQKQQFGDEEEGLYTQKL